MFEVIEKRPIKFGDWPSRGTGTQDTKQSSTASETNNRSNVIVDAEQSKLMNLDKEYTKKDVALRILRTLHKKGWRTKVTIIKDTKDLTKMTTQQLFSTLKVYEFDLDFDEEVGEMSIKTPTKSIAFKVTKSDSVKRSEYKKEARHDKDVVEDSNDPDLADMSMKETMTLILKRFDKISNRYGKYKKFYKEGKSRGQNSRKSSHSDQRYKYRSLDRSSSRRPESSSSRRGAKCYNPIYNP
ncbi:hypothetical protein ACS0TY_018210 [Phlomoides rotata]